MGHRFLQLQKMTTTASLLFTNYTTFQKAKQTSLTKKWGYTAVHRNQALDYECILIRFEHMSSERQHDICNEQ